MQSPKSKILNIEQLLLGAQRKHLYGNLAEWVLIHLIFYSFPKKTHPNVLNGG